jgi:hypothetical protein
MSDPVRLVLSASGLRYIEQDRARRSRNVPLRLGSLQVGVVKNLSVNDRDELCGELVFSPGVASDGLVDVLGLWIAVSEDRRAIVGACIGQPPRLAGDPVEWTRSSATVAVEKQPAFIGTGQEVRS